MRVLEGHVVKYRAVFFRVKGNIKRLEIEGYGYAIENQHNNIVRVDNGVAIVSVMVSDIVMNYGPKKILRHKND